MGHTELSYQNKMRRRTLLKNQYRFVVEYECEETGVTKTYGLWATDASVAVARTIATIDEEHHHKTDDPYFLTPRHSKEKTDFTID